MTDRLQGRRILVTGAAGGIGRACAAAFVAAGAAVALADRDRAGLDALAAALAPKGRVTTLTLDLTDRKAVAAGVGEAVKALGGLDGVLNTAGIDLHAPFAPMDWADWDRLMAINLSGPLQVCQAAIEPLKASGKGAIVNIASAAGLRPLTDRVAYCASKAGLIMATKALALDLGPHGIRANTVCPGATDTALFRQWLGPNDTMAEVKARYALNRIGSTSEVAATVLFLMSDEASFITGAALAVDGGRVFH